MAKIYDALYYDGNVYNMDLQAICADLQGELKNVDKIFMVKLTACGVLDNCEKLCEKWRSNTRYARVAGQCKNNMNKVVMRSVKGGDSYFHETTNEVSKIYDKQPLSEELKEALLNKIKETKDEIEKTEAANFIQSVLQGLRDELQIETKRYCYTEINISFLDKRMSIREHKKKMSQFFDAFCSACRIYANLFGVKINDKDAKRQFTIYRYFNIQETKKCDKQDIYSFIFENKNERDLSDLRSTIFNPKFASNEFLYSMFCALETRVGSPNIAVLKNLEMKDGELLNECKYAILNDGGGRNFIIVYPNIREIVKLLNNDNEKIIKMLLEAESKED